MAHQIMLNDADYRRLVSAAQRQGVAVEDVLHDAIAAHVEGQAGSYRRPTGEVVSDAVLQENERLAVLIGPAKPWASDMVIEDRGAR